MHRILGLFVTTQVAGGLTFTSLEITLNDPPHSKVRDHLATLAHVAENTRPQDTFMDGFTGLGVFRPHAYRYFFLHDEVRALLVVRCGPLP